VTNRNFGPQVRNWDAPLENAAFIRPSSTGISRRNSVGHAWTRL